MRLAEFFVGVAAKQIRPVEVDPRTSNQHEFNGINSFRKIFGDNDRSFETVFMYLTDQDEPVCAVGRATWYDSRRNQSRRSAEYRLYFSSSDVSSRFCAGDLLIIGLRADGTLMIVASPNGTSIGEQLLWLFGLESPGDRQVVRDEPELDRDVDYVVRWVLDALGIEAVMPAIDTEVLVNRFGMEMPTTRVFSKFAREMAAYCDPTKDADHALMLWLDTEEQYFRAFERLLVEQRLRAGFVDEVGCVDVDGFVSYSLSVQNRRKSRAGHGLENHLEEIFSGSKLAFERGATTEGRSRPDFLFPGSLAYFDETYAADRLAVLGAKASCKDRWRQVTAEADRIVRKHLVTLEPSISIHQTDEMRSRNVQLILPRQLHSTYTEAQQEWIWTLSEFIDYVRRQQL